MFSIGVDGCRAGWLAVRLKLGTIPQIKLFPTINDLWGKWGNNCFLLLIDMPIGLAETDSSRECDKQARMKFKGSKAASIFNPPVRKVLKYSNWKKASDVNKKLSGKRLSLQSWGIVPKIKELDKFIARIPQLQDVIHEAHPELLFMMLNNGKNLSASKKNSAGVTERLKILENFHKGISKVAFSGFKKFPRKQVQRDDIIDALVLAIIAMNHKNQLISLPEDPPRDSKGLKMEIIIPDL